MKQFAYDTVAVGAAATSVTASWLNILEGGLAVLAMLITVGICIYRLLIARKEYREKTRSQKQ